MKRFGVFLIGTMVCIGLMGALPWGPGALAEEAKLKEGQVRINGIVLTPENILEFEAVYGVRPVPGDYWYDTVSGLYGKVGQQAAGSMLPGHTIGQLAANASAGNTGVFFNGRELTTIEVNYIAILLNSPAIPGRYWLDAFGNCGFEGIPIPLVNFYEVAQMRFGGGGGGGSVGGGGSGGGGGDNFWSSHFGAGNYDSDNSRGYVSVPGHGPVGYGF